MCDAAQGGIAVPMFSPKGVEYAVLVAGAYALNGAGDSGCRDMECLQVVIESPRIAFERDWPRQPTVEKSWFGRRTSSKEPAMSVPTANGNGRRPAKYKTCTVQLLRPKFSQYARQLLMTLAKEFQSDCLLSRRHVLHLEAFQDIEGVCRVPIEIVGEKKELLAFLLTISDLNVAIGHNDIRLTVNASTSTVIHLGPFAQELQAKVPPLRRPIPGFLLYSCGA
ncbi:hypothetical protein FIBSPDRAFT_924371 [Athelia psychrophila]|uniref:Uncharacterized protein n=1 Tax=Athelia psychrophila TaxID=1759441 RepID=A0A166WSH8_9AGAM|nr:hypothetical protein FIBSPDRAFT_924371 [Fibularhizoctonia sp. CBS 109695]